MEKCKVFCNSMREGCLRFFLKMKNPRFGRLSIFLAEFLDE